MPRKNGPWKIESSREIYKNPWMAVREDSVVSGSGKRTIFGISKLNDWVMVLPIDENNNVYLVKQFRYALGKDSIEAPAGSIGK